MTLESTNEQDLILRERSPCPFRKRRNRLQTFQFSQMFQLKFYSLIKMSKGDTILHLNQLHP